MNKVLATLIAAALVALAPTPLRAQGDGPVQTRLEARKVVRDADGREAFVAAEAVRPGDVIEYVATYRNTGSAPVRDLEATLPIPAHTELLAGSARPVGARASLDAREFAAPPLKRTVRRDGRAVEEAIPTREYRYLRWSQPVLAPNQAVAFRARVRVADEPK